MMASHLGLCGLQEFQAELTELQKFPWMVAAGADEASMRMVGKLPPKKHTLADTLFVWWVAILPLAARQAIDAPPR
jgi:hypothetical protein